MKITDSEHDFVLGLLARCGLQRRGASHADLLLYFVSLGLWRRGFRGPEIKYWWMNSRCPARSGLSRTSKQRYHA